MNKDQTSGLVLSSQLGQSACARGRQEGERGWDAGRDGQAGPGCLVTDSGLLSPLAGLSSSEPGLAQEWNAVEGDESEDSQVSWGFLLFHRCPPTPLQTSAGGPSFSTCLGL